MTHSYMKAIFRLPEYYRKLLFYMDDGKVADGIQTFFGTTEGMIQLREDLAFTLARGRKLWYSTIFADIATLIEAEANSEIASTLVPSIKEEILSDLQSAEKSIIEINDYIKQHLDIFAYSLNIEWEKYVCPDGAVTFKVRDGFKTSSREQHPLMMLMQDDASVYCQDIIEAYQRFLKVAPEAAVKKIEKLTALAQNFEERVFNEDRQTFYSTYALAPTLDEGLRKTIEIQSDADVGEFARLYCKVRAEVEDASFIEEVLGFSFF